MDQPEGMDSIGVRNSRVDIRNLMRNAGNVLLLYSSTPFPLNGPPFTGYIKIIPPVLFPSQQVAVRECGSAGAIVRIASRQRPVQGPDEISWNCEPRCQSRVLGPNLFHHSSVKELTTHVLHESPVIYRQTEDLRGEGLCFQSARGSVLRSKEDCVLEPYYGDPYPIYLKGSTRDATA